MWFLPALAVVGCGDDDEGSGDDDDEDDVDDDGGGDVESDAARSGGGEGTDNRSSKIDPITSRWDQNWGRLNTHVDRLGRLVR